MTCCKNPNTIPYPCLLHGFYPVLYLNSLQDMPKSFFFLLFFSLSFICLKKMFFLYKHPLLSGMAISKGENGGLCYSSSEQRLPLSGERAQCESAINRYYNNSNAE